MTIVTYNRPWSVSSSGGTYEGYYNQSEVSPRVNGKLRLRSNAHEYSLARVTAFGQSHGVNDCGGAENAASFPWTTAQSNEVYAKFVGKLRAGDADLGVTLASWQQSANMIVDRLEKLKDFFSLRRVSRRRRRRRPQREDRFSRRQLASDVLEGEFGWLPLVADIHACLTTVCGEQAIPSNWVHATSRFSMEKYTDAVGNPRRITRDSGRGRITYAAKVSVTNPNLWLLNRLGLINPLVVAWDLVPWSFVVNMFVNVNQLLGSLTDTVGLTLTDVSQTKSYSTLREQQTQWHSGVAQNRTSWSNVLKRHRVRTAGSIPKPSLQAKVPNLDWNLAVIASALVVQKVKAFH